MDGGNYNRPIMASHKRPNVKQAKNTVLRYNIFGAIMISILVATTSKNLMVVNASSDNESSNVDG